MSRTIRGSQGWETERAAPPSIAEHINTALMLLAFAAAVALPIALRFA